MPAEVVTDPYDIYLANVNAENKNFGVYHNYHNVDTDVWEVMGPLDSGNGKTPVKLSQFPTIWRENFVVSSKCEHPEAALRLLDVICSEEWALQGAFGTFEGDYMINNGDGTYIATGTVPPSGNVNNEVCPVYRAPLLITPEMVNKVTFAEDNANYVRAKAVDHYLENSYVMPVSHILPAFAVSTAASEEANDLKGELTAVISAYYADWILNGGVEDNWEVMVEELEDMGLERYLEILQTEYDTLMGK